MKKLLLVAILAAAAAAPACGDGSKDSTPASGSPAASGGGPSGGGKKTAIHFTKNVDEESPYDTPCIGIVTTETIYGDKNDKITWKIKKNGGEGGGDDCEADLSKVNLHFQNPNAVSPNPAWAGNNGHADEIEVTVSNSEPDYNGSKRQKYQVYIDTKPAGPDPIIIVNCGSCGPGGGGPGD